MNSPNIILIILDTLRSDTLYSQLDNTSAFRKLARDGIVYKNVIAPSPWTIPSHASIFTGKYPSEHGVHYIEGDNKLVETTERSLEMGRTFPEELEAIGYVNVSVSANTLVSAGTGFERGFSRCETTDLNEKLALASRIVNRIPPNIGGKGLGKLVRMILKGKLDDITRLGYTNFRLLRYFDRVGYPFYKGGREVIQRSLPNISEAPFFNFINMMEAHEPYSPLGFNALFPGNKEIWNTRKDLLYQNRITERYLSQARKRYADSVQVLDSNVDMLINDLREKSLYDNCLIIITSDHGQSLKEKNFFGHTTYLYEELTRVPMIIKYPNSEKMPVAKGYQSLVDLRDFIVQWARGEKKPFPSKETVFSEAYGNPWLGSGNGNNDLKTDRSFLGVRKAVYKNGLKMTVNGTNGTIEELISGGGTLDVNSHNKDITELLDELYIFSGNEKFEIPSVSAVGLNTKE